jgi:hypothetical protein
MTSRLVGGVRVCSLCKSEMMRLPENRNSSRVRYVCYCVPWRQNMAVLEHARRKKR